MKKALSFILSVLMLASCIGTFTASAETPDSIQIAITTCGAKDQRCTYTNTTDSEGRPVQKIIPDDSQAPTSNMAPAYFSDSGAVNTFTGESYTKADRQNYDYKAVKIVVYTSKGSTSTPSLACFNSSYAQKAVNPAVGGPLQGGKWNTLIFDISDCTNLTADTPLYAYMFRLFGSDAVSGYVGEDIYIGYTGLFKTVDAAKAHVSEFEAEEEEKDNGLRIAITDCGASDQRCTYTNTTDSEGRAVQKIVPDDSSKPTSNMAPAYFSDRSSINAFTGGTETKEDRQSYDFKAVKIVVYVSETSTATPVLSAFNSSYASTSAALVSGGPLQGGKWNTLVFDISGCSNLSAAAPLYAYMFKLFGSEAVSAHMGEEIYIGYTGLFKSVDAAKAHVSEFETEEELSDLPAIPLTASWASPKDQRCNKETVTDEFGRTYNRYNAVQQYFEGGSDLTAKGAVAPGGSVGTPDSIGEYKIAKLVYRSTDTFVPTFYAVSSGFAKTYTAQPVGSADSTADKWHTVYFNFDKLGDAINMFMVNFSQDDVGNHTGDSYEIGYLGLFPTMANAQAHVSDFEGDLSITDIRLDGTGIGATAPAGGVDLAGSANVPVLTVKATGNTNDVVIANGTLDSEGKAVSTVKNGAETVVTVNFYGGSNEFRITGILVNGEPVEGFVSTTTTYEVVLPFGSGKPVVTYTYQGKEETVNVETTENGAGYKTVLSSGGTPLYTISFTVSTVKPEGLLHTLALLQSGEPFTVGYFGGSVTSGTGSSSSNNKSWRALTREWIKSGFPGASVTEVNAAVGGTGSVFGVFRADKQFIKDKAPDLCFIEMCVNDTYDSYGTPNGSEVNAYSSGNYVTFAESIIRKIYASNPKADIIIVITEDNGRMKSENYANDVPSFGSGYTELGKFYDIPVLYVSHELGKVILAENGGKTFPSTGDAAWAKYFGSDSVHPNDTGYAFYADVINAFLDENLPKSYVPTAEDDADKVLPASNYSKSPLLLDAYMVTPNELKDTEGGKVSNGHGSLGGMTLSESLTSAKSGQSATFLFKASTFGLWTWSYGTNNGVNGTNIKVSIDGGAEKTVNLYRSYPNHKVYILAEGLDSTRMHSVKITHADANATMDIRQFFLAGVSDPASKGVFVAPIIGGSDISVSVKHADGEPMDFTFDPKVYEYTLPVTDEELAVGYPIVTVTTATGSGFVVENATPTTRRALITLDSKEVYTINFANGNIPDGYTVEKASTPFGDDARLVFEEATEKDIQIKKDGEGWDDAETVKAGATAIEGLSAGLYQIRFVIEDGSYGMPVDVIVPFTFPENANVYYISDSGNGDGLTPENPAAFGQRLSNAVSGYKTAFKNDYKTKDAYIVLVGDCTHGNSASLDFADIPNITFMAQPGALLYMRTHINHANKAAPTGLVTWKDLNIILGDPTKATQSNMDGEIYYNAFGNNVLFDNVAIAGYITNEELGITRTKGIYLHSFGDGGGSYTVPAKGTITVNSPDLRIEATRSSGFGACEAAGDASYVIEDADIVSFGIGGHGSAAFNSGANRGVINGGTFGNIYVGPCSSGTIRGSAAVIINGIGSLSGKIQAKNTTTQDIVLILNNGLSDTLYSKVTAANMDYIIKSGVGGTADVEFAGADGTEKTADSFVFTTDRPAIRIDGETYEVKDGVYTVSAADLGTGVHTVEYIAGPSDITFKVNGLIGITRSSADAPVNFAKLAVASPDLSEVYAIADIETADTRTFKGNAFLYESEFTFNSGVVSEFVLAIVKTGYLVDVSDSYSLNNLEDGDVIGYSAQLIGGDIPEKAGDILGDGVIDMADFVRLIHAMEAAESGADVSDADINEDGVITVADLAFIKASFPIIEEPLCVRAVKTNNVCADYGGGLDHSEPLVDEATGLNYMHFTPKSGSTSGVHLDCWGLPKLDVTGGTLIIKGLVRTNYSKEPPFINVYNVYNAEGTNISSSLSINAAAEEKLKADENWEEFYVVIDSFAGTGAVYTTQTHVKTWGAGATAGNVPADAYYDVACWAVFTDMYSAEHTDLRKFCK